MTATYDKGNILGRGASGVAFVVRPKKDPRLEFVAKEICLMRLDEKRRREAFAESRLLRELRHEHIVTCLDVFEEMDMLYIVMEYATGGDLGRRIQAQRAEGARFSESVIMRAGGLWRKIMHRDVKPANVFIAGDSRSQSDLSLCTVKLGDFGIAKMVEGTMGQANSTVGTPSYLSPEICKNNPYGFKADVWSLGVVLYEMICLKVPFQASNLPAMALQICTVDPKPLPEEFSSDLHALVHQLLQKDPLKRPAMSAVVDEPFVKGFMPELDATTSSLPSSLPSGWQSKLPGIEAEADALGDSSGFHEIEWDPRRRGKRRGRPPLMEDEGYVRSPARHSNRRRDEAEPKAKDTSQAAAEVVQASKQTLPEASEVFGPVTSFQSSVEKDSPTLSRLDKFSRLESLAHLEVDEEVLRGIPLHHTLQVGLGQWSSPKEMSQRKQEALYDKSSPTLHFDIFFSHTWLTTGNRKYVALLFHNGWPVMVTSKITMAPLFVESVVLTLLVGIFAVSAGVWVGAALRSMEEYTVLHILLTSIFSSVPLLGIIHVLRKETRAKRQLLLDLESFSLDRAECLSDFDREFIHSAIDKWYGSAEAFAKYVRGPLRAELLQSNAATVPSAYLMTCVISIESIQVELFLALVKGGAPLQCILAVLVGLMVGPVFYQLSCFKLMLKLAEKFAEPCNAILDLLQTFLIWLTTWFLLVICGSATVTLLSRPNVLPLLLLVLFECLVFLAAFGHLPLRRVCLRSSDRT
ncbi:unnamed protein product [Effrenium voratum]|nr:unnamed protein product [Effrenium voratum]